MVPSWAGKNTPRVSWGALDLKRGASTSGSMFMGSGSMMRGKSFFAEKHEVLIFEPRSMAWMFLSEARCYPRAGGIPSPPWC